MVPEDYEYEDVPGEDIPVEDSYEQEAEETLEDILTGESSLIELATGMDITNPLNPKSKYNLNIKAYTDRKIGRKSKTSKTTGKRWTQIRRWSCLACSNMQGATYLPGSDGQRTIRSNSNSRSTLTYYGLIISVNKKPMSGSGWDEVIKIEDTTSYVAAQFTSGVIPNPTLSNTGDHFHLIYGKNDFDGAMSASGTFNVEIEVTYASGHTETMSAISPVGDYESVLDWNPQQITNVDLELETVHCGENSYQEFYSHISTHTYTGGVSSGSNGLMMNQPYFIWTAFTDDSAYNAGSMEQGGLVKYYSGADLIDLHTMNPIPDPWFDPLAHEYGLDGHIGTPLSTHTGKQFVHRLDILAQLNNSNYPDVVGQGTTWSDISSSPWWTSLSTNTLSNTWAGYAVDTFSNDVNYTQMSLPTYMAGLYSLFIGRSLQLFTFTTLYSENITSCGTTSTSYTVCNSTGNPSHFEDTEKDCSGSTIPTADLPGGTNYSNVTYIHDQACCTVCTLIVTAQSYDSDYNANNGYISWNTLDAGSPSGDTWSTGSMYTVVVTNWDGTAVTTGTNAPAGGATVSIATTVNDTSGTANRFTVSSNAQIVPGMKIQSGHTFYDAATGGSAVTAYVGPVYAGNLNNNATEFYLEDEFGAAVYSQSDATPTLVFATGFQGEWGALAPNDASNPYYILKVTDESGCYVESPHVIMENTAPTGCTDNTAVNYDASAVVDDGSCILCQAADGLLHDPGSSNSTNLFDSFVATPTSATWNSGTGASTTHNSDGTLSVSASIIAAVAGYLDYHSTEKIEFLLYKTLAPGDASTAAGATQIGGTINAGTLDVIGTTAAHQFTGLAYGYYTIRVRYVDTDQTKTLEDCWAEFFGIVKAEVCDDASNASYMTVPTSYDLRDAQNTLLCQSSIPCCVIDSYIEQTTKHCATTCSPLLEVEIGCDPNRTVDVEWEFSTNGSTYTSLGTFNISNVSTPNVYFYDTTTGQPSCPGYFAVNGTGWYRVTATATHINTNDVCVVTDAKLFTMPRSGCTDPTAHNYDPTNPPCPAPCIMPSWDCDGNGNCIDPMDGSGAFNCDDASDPNCCNTISCPPPPTYGCTDPCATNYDSGAIIDDGSCTYRACLDQAASNYLYSCDCNKNVASATIPDPGCCILPCATQNAVVTNTIDATSTCTVFNTDGSVSVTVTINTVATTWTWEIWDSGMATLIYADTTGGAAGTGVYTGSGTSDVYASLGVGTYNVKVTDNLGCEKIEYFVIGSSGPKVGCTDPAADNYDPTAVCDCCCIVCGCMDPNALNYNPNANTPCQCDYDIGDDEPNPCVPQDLEDRKLEISGCLVAKGSDWLTKYKIGTNVDCSTMDKWKLIFINYLLDQDNLDCLFNCADVQTVDVTALQNCHDKWVQGGPSTGLNHDPNHAAAYVLPGEGTTVTAYDDFPNGWFGRDTALNPSNNFTFVGDMIKWDLPVGHTFAADLNGTIWELTTIPSNPQGAHFGCSPNGKITHYTKCLDYTKITVTTTTNYYDKFINFANKFCKDCKISLI